MSDNDPKSSRDLPETKALVSGQTESQMKFWTRTSQIQLAYVVLVNLSSMSVGISFGFATVVTSQLRKFKSIKVSNYEESWIASIVNLSAPIGCVVIGYAMDRFGRKIAFIICNIPSIIGWILIGTATTFAQIFIGRLLCGVGAGMVMPLPKIYTSEITLPNMRGTLGMFANIAFAMGTTIVAFMGSIMHWYIIAYVTAAFHVGILLINIFVLPETPHYLVLKRKTEKAFKNLKRFRSSKFNVNEEIDEMTKKIGLNNKKDSFKDTIKLLFKPSTCKPFRIIMLYVIFAHSTGISVLLFWTHDAIERSKCNVSSEISNIVLNTTRTVASFFGSFILYIMGRRAVSIISGVGVGVSSLLVALYLQFTTKDTIFPLICFAVNVFSAAFGIYGLPFLLVGEMFPLKVRGIIGGITVSLLNIVLFACIKLYAAVRNYINFVVLMYIFSFMALLSCCYFYFCLPETKTSTLLEIEEYFEKKSGFFIPRQEWTLSTKRKNK